MKFDKEIEEIVYQEYLDMDPKAYQDKIRFFEFNSSEISSLDYPLFLEIRFDYLFSLFEVGEYYSFLNNVDPLLNAVIEESIVLKGFEDIFQELLFRKACALHNTIDFHAADYHYSELIKIDPLNQTYKLAYQKNVISKMRSESQKMRGFQILLLFIAGLVIAVELLIVKTFYANWLHIFETTRNIMLASSILLMVSQEIRMRYISYRRIQSIVNSVKHKIN